MDAYTAKDTAGTVNPISSDWLGALPRASTIFIIIVEYKDKENNGLRSVEGCTSPLHGERGERYPRGPPIIMTLSTSG